MKIKIADIDLSLQTRAGTDAETIDNYAEAMKDGSHFPPVTVFTDGKHKWLSDGFHRVMAKKQNGEQFIDADVRKGDENDAVVFGGTANNKQGKRTTRADVQHFLEMVWERRKAIFGGTPTGGNLADKCGVSRETGRKFIEEKLSEMPPPPSRTTVKVGQLKKSPPIPVRPTELIGKNGKKYAAPPVRPFPARPAPVRPPVKKGYHIGPDGKQHADGVALDQFGVEIPERIRTAFTSEILGEIVSTLQRARTMLAQAIRSKDPSVAAVAQRAGLEMENAYHELKAAKPYCVCRMCQGQGCDACRETGFQTEDQFKRNPPEFNP